MISSFFMIVFCSLKYTRSFTHSSEIAFFVVVETVILKQRLPANYTSNNGLRNFTLLNFRLRLQCIELRLKFLFQRCVYTRSNFITIVYTMLLFSISIRVTMGHVKSANSSITMKRLLDKFQLLQCG